MSGPLEPGENVLAEFAFKRRGCLFLFARLMSPLIGPQPAAAYVTDRRVFKVSPKGKVRAVARGNIVKVFWNTTSDSFHVEADPRSQSTEISLATNAPEIAAALESLGIEVEREKLSARRPHMR